MKKSNLIRGKGICEGTSKCSSAAMVQEQAAANLDWAIYNYHNLQNLAGDHWSIFNLAIIKMKIHAVLFILAIANVKTDP